MSTTSRNAPCPCGSGRKYKQCCLKKDGPAAASNAPAQQLAAARRLVAMGSFGRARAAFTAILRIKPDHVPAVYELGQIEGLLGNWIRGTELMRSAHLMDPSSVTYAVGLASILHLGGHPDAALEMAKKAVELDAQAANAHVTLAMCLERRNQIDEARAANDRALELDARNSDAWLLDARLRERSGDLAGAGDRLTQLLERPDLSATLKPDALAQLGKIDESRGRYAEAWTSFVAAGAAIRADPAYAQVNTDLWPQRIALNQAGFTAEVLNRFATTGENDGLPVARFLMGFSRSGTTLIEQILAAHPAVVTSGEAPLIQAVRKELVGWHGGDENVAGHLAALSPERAGALRRLYWSKARRLAGDRWTPETIFVHKQPLNTIDIGLIATLFPESRSIVVLRDPRDVCVSCFQQNFTINTSNIHFTRFEDTASFYAQTMGLWLALRDLIGDRATEIRYESVTSDFATTARDLLSALDIPWDAKVLHYNEDAPDRVIMTPSYEAVTHRPHESAVGRWKRYATQIEPNLNLLAPFVDVFGYE